MSINKNPEQVNVLDGTVYVMDERPGVGAYITIAGRDDHPYILAFSLDDLRVFAEVAARVVTS